MRADWSASPTERPFLIAASSARALAASAARAGYRVSAVDLFNDADLIEIVDRSARAARRKSGGFAAGAFLTAAARLAPPGARPKFGFVYGSGFEDRPELLARIAKRFAVFGNRASVLRRCKDPVRLARLLGGLGLPHPGIRMAPPPRSEMADWLVKRRGASGGIHIRDAARAKPGHGDYFQRKIAGDPVSACVLGNGKDAIVLGLSAQDTAPGKGLPFRYGGLAAPADLPRGLANAIESAARRIAMQLKLRGLNGVDFIVRDDAFWVIEVNPRPTASLELFETICGTSLFDLHVRACAGELPRGLLPIRPHRAAASRVVYARKSIRIPPGFAWPAWSTDRPRAGTVIRENEPVCSVLAEATTAFKARALARRRCETLRAALLRCMQSTARQDAALPLHRGGTRQEGKRVEQTRREHSHTA